MCSSCDSRDTTSGPYFSLEFYDDLQEIAAEHLQERSTMAEEALRYIIALSVRKEAKELLGWY